MDLYVCKAMLGFTDVTAQSKSMKELPCTCIAVLSLYPNISIVFLWLKFIFIKTKYMYLGFGSVEAEYQWQGIKGNGIVEGWLITVACFILMDITKEC